MIIRVSIPCVY